MAHFAKLDNDNKVISVHVVNNEVITNDGIESEQIGIDFLTDIHGHSHWKQCSYNGSFRKHYPGIGYTYNETLDAFISPQPHPSWTLDELTCTWGAPVAYPSDGKRYKWNEETTSWVETQE